MRKLWKEVTSTTKVGAAGKSLGFSDFQRSWTVKLFRTSELAGQVQPGVVLLKTWNSYEYMEIVLFAILYHNSLSTENIFWKDATRSLLQLITPTHTRTQTFGAMIIAIKNILRNTSSTEVSRKFLSRQLFSVSVFVHCTAVSTPWSLQNFQMDVIYEVISWELSLRLVNKGSIYCHIGYSHHPVVAVHPVWWLMMVWCGRDATTSATILMTQANRCKLEVSNPYEIRWTIVAI